MPQSALVPLAIASTVVGTGISIYGQQQQAKAAKATAEFNAKVDEIQAESTENERAENVKRLRQRNRRLMGTQRARLAKAGVIDEGSPLDLMAETAGELELGILDANRAAEAKKTGLRQQAGITRMEGRNLARARTLQSVGTGIGGVRQTTLLANRL